MRISTHVWKVAACALATAGCSAMPARMFPLAFPGAKQVVVDGRRVTCARLGKGSVTVVLEAGMGDGMDTWDRVFRPVSSFATVFAYNRPGYPGSDDSKEPRTGAQAVAELRALLSAEALPPPYVLVGHSLGGLYVQLFARAHPEEVGALVLVDSRPEPMTRRCREELGPSVCDPPPILEATASFPSHVMAEHRGAEETERQVREAPALPNVPVVVIAAGRRHPLSKQAFYDLWLALEKELAAGAPLGRFVLAEGSTHYVHRKRPELVVALIREVVEALQERASPGSRPGARSKSPARPVPGVEPGP